MIKMTDRELVEFVFKIADWHENTCSTEWDWVKDGMLYILNEIAHDILERVWEKDEGCNVSELEEYWSSLIEEFIKERSGEDSKKIKDETKQGILRELKKIEKLLEEE